MEPSINTNQIHYRGIPASNSYEETPGSILEHQSTSMRVKMLSCHVVGADKTEIDLPLFENASEDLLKKTRERFFYRCRKELGDKILIRDPEKVRLLIPKTGTESGINIMVSIWPKVFVCRGCSLIYKPTDEDMRLMYSTGSFKECTCSKGDFRQTPHILQCKICGSIRNIPDYCCEKGCKARVHLRKGNEVDLKTWRIQCENGHVHDFKDFHNIYYCDGSDQLIPKDLHEQIANGKDAPRFPKTTVGRGIYSPLIMRFPSGDKNVLGGDALLTQNHKILVAANSHILDLKIFKKIQRAERKYKPGGDIYRRIVESLEDEGEEVTPEAVEQAIQKAPADGDKGWITNEMLKELEKLTNYRVRKYSFENHIDTDGLRARCEDWNTILSGYSANGGEPHALSELPAFLENSEYKETAERLGLLQVKYIERISIVTGTYGSVRGSILPIYNGKKLEPTRMPLEVGYNLADDRIAYIKCDKQSLPVIVTKKETEGVAFILKIKPMLKVIQQVEPLLAKETLGVADLEELSEEEARAWLLYAYHSPKLSPQAKARIDCIVHSISHAVIRRLARVGGLRESDVFEMLFPEFGAFLLYNGLEKPLGLLKRIFMDGLPVLFNTEMADEVRDCDMDPICFNQEEGAACHACLHVPEHVCERFNADLDRKVLFGPDGYWQ